MSKKNQGIFRHLKKLVFLTGVAVVFNKLYPLYASRRHLLNADEGSYFEWRGLKIFCRKTGSGSPVILLHALHPASSSREWDRILPILEKHHTVYIPDLPGCGLSDKPRFLYTNFLYVSLLRDFIKANHLEGASVVASNLSCSIPVMTEAYEAGTIGPMLLISPPSIAALAETPDTKARIIMKVLSFPIVGPFIYNILCSRQQVDLSFSEKYFYNPFHGTDDLVDTYFESAHLGGDGTSYFAGSYYGKYLNVNVSRAVRQLTVPVKIIEGRETDNSEGILLEWKSHNPSVETTSIASTKQLPHLENPEETSKEILSFLQA